MPIYAKSGASFTPAPQGTHAAVCVDVVDLGNLKVTFGGKEKEQHKIKIVWQIEEARDDGKPFQVAKRYTCSLHEKASLRKDLESWRGRPFTGPELEQFDLEVLLNVGCFVNVVHAVKGGETYANVSAVIKLPKAMVAPTQRDYVRVCDREQQTDTPDTSAPGQSDDFEISDSDVPF
jgi:hypothetical protein